MINAETVKAYCFVVVTPFLGAHEEKALKAITARATVHLAFCRGDIKLVAETTVGAIPAHLVITVSAAQPILVVKLI